MSGLTGILKKMSYNFGEVRFADVCKICDHYFGQAMQMNRIHFRVRLEY